jgi:mycothiol synthase
MIDHQLFLPDAPAIDGLRFRAFEPDRDYPVLAELIGSVHVADGVDWIPTAETLRVDYEHTAEFDPRRDVVMAQVGRELVAAAEVSVRVRDGSAVHDLNGWVRPSHRRRGLGRALLRWSERRAAEVAAVDGRIGPRHLDSWLDESNAGARALFRAEGYLVTRFGYQMIRDLRQPIPPAELPEGIEIRPVREADHRRIWDADAEAFLDLWNATTRTEEDFVGWFANPDLDTSLWRVGWDGDEVAGVVATFVYPEDNERLGLSRGWLEHVSVRRPWRRRGLASALIADAMRGLAARGIREAALGVDAENVSGALRVYEALGFRRDKADLLHRKTFQTPAPSA